MLITPCSGTSTRPESSRPPMSQCYSRCCSTLPQCLWWRACSNLQLVRLLLYIDDMLTFITERIKTVLITVVYVCIIMLYIADVRGHVQDHVVYMDTPIHCVLACRSHRFAIINNTQCACTSTPPLTYACTPTIHTCVPSMQACALDEASTQIAVYR